MRRERWARESLQSTSQMTQCTIVSLETIDQTIYSSRICCIYTIYSSFSLRPLDGKATGKSERTPNGLLMDPHGSHYYTTTYTQQQQKQKQQQNRKNIAFESSPISAYKYIPCVCCVQYIVSIYKRTWDTRSQRKRKSYDEQIDIIPQQFGTPQFRDSVPFNVETTAVVD